MYAPLTRAAWVPQRRVELQPECFLTERGHAYAEDRRDDAASVTKAKSDTWNHGAAEVASTAIARFVAS
jgi:hypothetical protein